MIVFDLKKQKYEMVNCEFNHDVFKNENNGYFKGQITNLPQVYTLIYGFEVFSHEGDDITIFEFGSYQKNTGYGLYINNKGHVAFRVNNDYDNYKTIYRCVVLNKFNYVKIIKTKKDLSLYVNNKMLFYTQSKINQFDNYGGFSRAHAGGNAESFFRGIITPFKIYDEIIDDSVNYFDKIKQTLLCCPNCEGLNLQFENVYFNPYPKGNEKTDYDNYICYKKCIDCNTVFSTEMMMWSPDKFKEKCYNENLKYYDFEYVLPFGERTLLKKQYLCNNYDRDIYHLNYGSNQEFLQNLLKQNGFNQTYIYDPFTKNNDKEILNKTYDLITCFEFIQHDCNINETFKLFKKILNKKGKIIFTTYLYNNEDLKTWQYCNPRIGNILFFTLEGIKKFINKHGFEIENVEKFQDKHIFTIKNSNNIKINFKDTKKIVNYLEAGNNYLIQMKNHCFGDVIMFYPIFKKLQSLYPNCTIDFRGKIGQEYFSSITTNDYDIIFQLEFLQSKNNISKVEKCCIEEIGIPFTKDLDFTFKPIHKIGKIIGVNFIIDSNKNENLSYNNAKKVWNKIKEMGYIPLEIIFYHKGAKYRSEKYDFIDFTTRDIKAEPETTFNIIASCEAFIGVNSGTLVAASIINPEKCLYLNTSISFSNYKKFNPIKEIDCHEDVDLKFIENFIKKLYEK